MPQFLKKCQNIWVEAVVILLSTILLAAGAWWARYTPPPNAINDMSATAVVTSIVDKKTESYQLSGEQGDFVTTTIAFRARITSGELKNLEVTAHQVQDSLIAGTPKDVEIGDKVVIDFLDSGTGEQQWLFMEYYRTDSLIWLGVAFLLLLILFGRSKGVNTIISLGFTVLAVFLVFVPSILNGHNIYWMSSLTCAFCTISTLLIVSGWSKKTMIATIGCLVGLVFTGLLTLLMSHIMNLTGLTDSNSIYLSTMTDINIDLRAVIFGAILVGALGAVMDVSMSLSSSLLEVSEQMGERRNYQALFRSGMNIGRDMMGTMANTLILAYIGSSLSVVLLLVANESSLRALFNREMIVVEVMQALVGSMGILFTIPATSMLAAWLYSRKPAPNGKKTEK